MIYIINPENKPNTNKSIIAEPIDVLEIYEIIKQKYDAKFLDLDIKQQLPKLDREDILVICYDYIIPLHTEDALINIKNILSKNKNNKKILISKQCFQNYKLFFEIGFNFLIYSNPEYTINILINSILNKDFNNLKNTLYIDNNILVKTPLDKQKLDYIIPNRNEINLTEYNDVRTIVSSIGCNNKCKFCPTPYFQGSWQSRNVKSIIDEIIYLNNLGCKKIMFLDDNFTTSKTRIDRICNSIKQHNINCKFGFLSSINNYNYNLFKKMYKCGFQWVHFGIESAENNTLKIMKKNQSNSQIKKTLKEVKKIGFKLRISLIIDYPGASENDFIKTIKLINIIKPNEIRLHFTAYRSLTPLFNEYKIENKQYIHNNNINEEQESIKNKYIKSLKEMNYTIIDDVNYNWNNNQDEFVASFVPIKYGRNWI